MSRSLRVARNPFLGGKIVAPKFNTMHNQIVRRGEHWLEQTGLRLVVPALSGRDGEYSNSLQGISFWGCDNCSCVTNSTFLTMHNLARFARVGAECLDRPNSSLSALNQCSCHTLPEWISFGIGTVAWIRSEGIPYSEPLCIPRNHEYPKCGCGNDSLIFILSPEGGKWWWLCEYCAGLMPDFEGVVPEPNLDSESATENPELVKLYCDAREHIENALAMGWRPL